MEVGKPFLGSRGKWPVTCDANAVITPDFVRETGYLFDAIAQKHGADYDGWEVAATP
ncbi:hypothetical protein GCM10022248_72990 [Nonomuraea soli]